MRGVPSQTVNRLRLFLLAVACWFCLVPTAHAIRPPTVAEELQLKEKSARPEPSLVYRVFVRNGEVRIGLFVGNSPLNFIDPIGLERDGDDGFPDLGNGTAAASYLYDKDTKKRHDQIICEGKKAIKDGAKAAAKEIGTQLALAAATDGLGNLARAAKLAKDAGEAAKAAKAAEDAAKLAKGQLVSKGVRDFMKGEKSLNQLTPEEINSAIKGYQNAADTAKNAIQKAYQEARINALRGQGAPPGTLSEFTKSFGK